MLMLAMNVFLPPSMAGWIAEQAKRPFVYRVVVGLLGGQVRMPTFWDHPIVRDFAKFINFPHPLKCKEATMQLN